MTSPAAESTGEDVPITPRRVKAWWPLLVAVATAAFFVAGGYFVFSGRFDLQDVKIEILKTATEKAIRDLNDRLDKSDAAGERRGEKNAEHLMSIEKALSRLEAIEMIKAAAKDK